MIKPNLFFWNIVIEQNFFSDCIRIKIAVYSILRLMLSQTPNKVFGECSAEERVSAYRRTSIGSWWSGPIIELMDGHIVDPKTNCLWLSESSHNDSTITWGTSKVGVGYAWRVFYAELFGGSHSIPLLLPSSDRQRQEELMGWGFLSLNISSFLGPPSDSVRPHQSIPPTEANLNQPARLLIVSCSIDVVADIVYVKS